MINFNEITVVLDAPVSKAQKKSLKYEGTKTSHGVRYIIGCDPADNDDEILDRGLNVFTVYDLFLQRTTLKSITHKTFTEFSESILNTKGELKSSYTISNKFITNGRPTKRSDIRPKA